LREACEGVQYLPHRRVREDASGRVPRRIAVHEASLVMKIRILSVAVALAVVSSSLFAQNEKTISVIAWNLVQPALDKLIPVFEQKTGYKVVSTWVAGPASRGRVAGGDVFDAAIMAGPIGEVLASGQVVIGSVRTLSGLKLSVTVRQGAPRPDISSFDAVKKTLLGAKSVAYVDPDRGTIGINAWATVQRLGIVEELRAKTVHGTGGPNAQELVAKGVADINLGPFYNDALVPGVERLGALPRDVSTPSPVIGAIGIHARDQAAARALLDFLGSAEANAVYRELNMETVP
jgi:molybdate transport system substrate-binding protein